MYVTNLKAALKRDADRTDCRQILKTGSHSFYAASLLLPDAYCEPITALYAFCRVADDAVDLADDPRRGLDSVRRRLDAVYANSPEDSPVDRSFASIVHRYRIPRELPDALLEGFSWDVEQRQYDTLSETYAYCTRVAGTVGVMLAMLLGIRDTEILSRACDLGVAMQLTNIARDVGEDARNGRLYLPHELLARNGVDVERFLQKPEASDGIARTLRQLLEIADEHYSRAEWGISRLPLSVRPGIFAARFVYAEIGRAVERNAFDSVTQRAYVPKRQKIRLLGKSVVRAMQSHSHDPAPPLRETLFLLEAVQNA